MFLNTILIILFEEYFVLKCKKKKKKADEPLKKKKKELALDFDAYLEVARFNKVFYDALVNYIAKQRKV